MYLGYFELYIRYIWLLVYLWNLCKPDMVLVYVYLNKFGLSLSLSLNLNVVPADWYICITWHQRYHSWSMPFVSWFEALSVHTKTMHALHFVMFRHYSILLRGHFTETIMGLLQCQWCNVELEQLEPLHSENTPCRPMITHTKDSFENASFINGLRNVKKVHITN